MFSDGTSVVDTATGTQHSGAPALTIVEFVILIFAVSVALNPQFQWTLNPSAGQDPGATARSRAGLLVTRIGAAVVAVVAVFFIVTGFGKL